MTDPMLRKIGEGFRESIINIINNEAYSQSVRLSNDNIDICISVMSNGGHTFYEYSSDCFEIPPLDIAYEGDKISPHLMLIATMLYRLEVTARTYIRPSPRGIAYLTIEGARVIAHITCYTKEDYCD